MPRSKELLADRIFPTVGLSLGIGRRRFLMRTFPRRSTSEGTSYSFFLILERKKKTMSYRYRKQVQT
jgi:hypothetical protein